MKDGLRDQHFSSNDVVIVSMKQWFTVFITGETYVDLFSYLSNEYQAVNKHKNLSLNICYGKEKNMDYNERPVYLRVFLLLLFL